MSRAGALWPTLLAVAVLATAVRADSLRHEWLLDDGWRSAAFETGKPAPARVETAAFDDTGWRQIEVPHNWDAYEGFRQVRHGDRHGTAWYRRVFTIPATENGRRVFLYFEGVGSYATVWVNGELAGQHAGGLTTFTLDITREARFGKSNLLVVKADHPAGIRDLPWVCGGCELAYGFSEGTQPFGIFRPVHLVTTGSVRIEPFGVHVWNEADVTPAAAQVHIETEVKNYGESATTVVLTTAIRSGPPESVPKSPWVVEVRTSITLAPGETKILRQDPQPVVNPLLWSPASPHLYTVDSKIAPDDRLSAGETVLDETTTEFGIRTIQWPSPSDKDGRFFVNGRPFFINGIADYEHNLGASHAFTDEEVRARVHEIEAGGFNAFRDAHHPHNLRFQSYWDRDGLLWWPQFGAHIWFDNPTFRQNFKSLLRDWVKERRNSPSLVLWGLQNESVLPESFAEECAAIIRELDPTATTQRKITTCNGGKGTDWDVPQNWSGTYSGDPLAYAADLRRQHLVGEYGAWRSLGLHSEGRFEAHGPLSENRMASLLEMKVREADSVQSEVAGQFLWLLTSHSNPGRNVGEHGEQLCDGIRPLDRISPVNNKGLFTIWGEPTDAYQMYRSNDLPASASPMVYIVSHTWPDRWTTPARKNGIVVYSNCDEVELFNDLGARSLGARKRAGIGTHFEWDDVPIETNILYAEGRVDGKVVACDLVQLHHLPDAPAFATLERSQPDLTAPRAGRNYLYRINCGGPDYVDHDGNRWAADRNYSPGDAWGAISWAADYPNLDPRFGSLRRTYDPIMGTRDPALFQTYRYGRNRLKYRFTVPNGDYELELYFIEPWYGDRNPGTFTTPAGTEPNGRVASRTTSFAGWRLFDVAVNGATALHNLDLWREAGRDTAVKKIIPVHAADGQIEISFPQVAAGQAVISAIAVSTSDQALRAPPAPRGLITELQIGDATHAREFVIRHSLDTGDAPYSDATGGFTTLPPELLESDWIQTPSASRNANVGALIQFRVTANAGVYIARSQTAPIPAWLQGWENTGWTVESKAAAGVRFTVFRRIFAADAIVTLGGNSDSRGGEQPMYSVFVVPQRPPPPPELVRNLSADSGDVRNVRATGHLESGREIFCDAHARIVALPSILADCDLISPPRHATGPVSFNVATDAEVYLALDPKWKGSLPDRLSDWVEVRDSIGTTDVDTPKFALWRHRFAPGGRVTLWGDTAPVGPYFVVVRAVRPALFLPASAAVVHGGQPVAAPMAPPNTSPIALTQGSGSSLSWTVAVGVGDRYGVNLLYTAPKPTAATRGELSIIAGDGRIVRSEKLTFPAVSQPWKWSTLRLRTDSSINAGSYQFRLTLLENEPLVFGSIEVE